MTASIRFWPGTRTLLTLDAQANLDLTAAVGQRQCTFRFALTDGVSGENLGDITPIREPARLSHDTQATTKRNLSISLGKSDLAEIDPIRDRINVYQVFPDVGQYPLGRYMFTAPQAQLFATQQRIGSLELNDEMFLVDQQISRGINGQSVGIAGLISDILTPLPVKFGMEQSPYFSAQSWGIGTGRGSVLEALAFTGDYFSPWFDNNAVLRFIRTFDPSTQVPDIDLDADLGVRVYQETPVETTDLVTAPNVFIVISNSGEEFGPAGEIIGRATVPPSAPHSVANRGFEIPEVLNVQLSSVTQAQAVASGLAQRQTVFEQTELVTAPDPRHDGYNVIRWNGSNWLELAWSMELTDGGEMRHLMRKGYATG